MPTDVTERVQRATRRFQLVDFLERWLPTPMARIIAWARSDEALSTAAGLAFFALVASVPSALIALWVTGSIVGFDGVNAAVERVTSSVDPSGAQAAAFFEQVVDVARRLGWGSVVAAIWPATTYGAGLARAFDRLTPQRQRPMDGIRGRLLGVVVVGMLPLVILGALAVVVLAPGGGSGWVVGTLGGGTMSFLAVATVTGVIFHLFSPVDVGSGAAVRGGAVSSGLVLVATIGFALYLRLGSGGDEQYASSTVALVVLLGLWLYLVNAALIVGYKAALHHAGADAWHQGRWEDEQAPPDDAEKRPTDRAGGTSRKPNPPDRIGYC